MYKRFSSSLLSPKVTCQGSGNNAAVEGTWPFSGRATFPRTSLEALLGNRPMPRPGSLTASHSGALLCRNKTLGLERSWWEVGRAQWRVDPAASLGP